MIVQLVDISQEADVLGSPLGGVLSLSCLEISPRRTSSIHKILPFSIEIILNPPSRSGGDLHTWAVIMFWRLVRGRLSSTRKNASHMRLIFDSVVAKITDTGPLAYALLESFLIVSLYIVCETSSSLFDVSRN
jgi:hypothetical protein